MDLVLLEIRLGSLVCYNFKLNVCSELSNCLLTLPTLHKSSPLTPKC